jgi:ABC-type polysaccharide/polyol phosphate export permease
MGRRRIYDEMVPAATAELEHETFDSTENDDEFLVSDSSERRPLLRHTYWHLVPALIRQQTRTRFSQSALHLAWNAIQPVALVVVYALFFNGVLEIGSGEVPYLSFIVAGLVPWRFVAAGLSSSSALTDNIHLISKVYFPREIIPIANSWSGLIDLAIGTVIIIVVAAAQGSAPSVHLVALPLAYLLVVLFATAGTIIVTTVAVFVRDVSHGMQMVLLGLFFATPIMYPESQLPSWLQWFTSVNPLAVAVNSVRDVTVLNVWPTWWLLMVHLVLSGAFLVGSMAYCRSVEHRMVDLA